ncbi:MAG: ABC transporter permease [Bryobacteraceae bacterium]|jgi:putative ABC transport system permease protein
MKRIMAVFAKRRIARELDEELRTHLELLADEYMRQGMTADEAHLAARRSMGNLAGMKEEYRDARGLPFVETLLQNVRYAGRVLWKSPGFTAVAIFALALGIGANTAIYSMADVVLLRPLQIANLDRVVNVIGTVPGVRLGVASMSPGDFADFREQSRTVQHLSVFFERDLNLTGSGDPQHVLAVAVSTDFFEALQAQPLLGRLFRAAQDYSGQPRVALLSYRLWQTQFGGDPGVTGRTIRLHGDPYEIAGVMGKEFQYPPEADMWIPMTLQPDERANHYARFLTTVGRLRPGATVAQATSEVDSIAQEIARRYPREHEHRGAKAELMSDNISGNAVRPIVTMLMGAAGFVLLLACVNVANLQLARLSLRAREIALRFAVGASRWRIVAQFLTESVVLSLAGAAGGVLFAIWATKAARGLVPPEMWRYMPGWERLGLNGHVLLFAIVAGALSGIVAGVAPALFASRTHLDEVLKEGGRAASGGARRHRMRNTFVAAQIVLAMVLLVGAEMMVKGLSLVTEPAPNLDAGHALSIFITLPQAKYPDAAHQRIFEQRVLDTVSALSGVSSAALVHPLPYSNSRSSVPVVIAGRPANQPAYAQNGMASPEYFRAMRLPVLSGRAFTAQDDENGAPVAIVSESFVRHWFPGEDAVGRQIRMGPPESRNPWLTIVGVATNIRNDAFERSFRDLVYQPIRQMPVDPFYILLRTSDPHNVTAPALAAIHAIDAELPAYNVMTMEKLFRLQVAPVRLIASVMASFGVLALILSTVGVYSVMSHAVSERKREIGVRMAMGAETRTLVWMFIRQSLTLAAVGMAIGGPAAFGLARVLEGLFYGVRSSDAAVFTMAVLAIASAAALASYSAARRAAGIDPVATLREE